MCDYSLHHVANRPAKIEDKLVATKFHNSITRGFAAVGQPNVAVCVLPGTEIAFDESVECEPSFGIGILPNKKIGQRLARVFLDEGLDLRTFIRPPLRRMIGLRVHAENQRGAELRQMFDVQLHGVRRI